MRLLPQRSFPPYQFVPGNNPHPEKPGGYHYGSGPLRLPPIDQYKPWESEDYLYSLDLFNYEYYWESHVWLEALWNAHQRQGPLADLLKGLIMLCAAGVKAELGQEMAMLGHIRRARELFDQIHAEQAVSEFLGLDLTRLIDFCQKGVQQNSSPFPVELPLTPEFLNKVKDKDFL